MGASLWQKPASKGVWVVQFKEVRLRGAHSRADRSIEAIFGQRERKEIKSIVDCGIHGFHSCIWAGASHLDKTSTVVRPYCKVVNTGPVCLTCQSCLSQVSIWSYWCFTSGHDYCHAEQIPVMYLFSFQYYNYVILNPETHHDTLYSDCSWSIR